MRTLTDLYFTALNVHFDNLVINSATNKIFIRQVRQACYVGHGIVFSTRRYVNNGRWNSSHFTPLFERTENNSINLLKIKYTSRNKIVTLFENCIVLYYSKISYVWKPEFLPYWLYHFYVTKFICIISVCQKDYSDNSF